MCVCCQIWSVGITALELAYGRAPYAKFPPMKVMLLTLQEDPPTAEIYKDHSYEFSKHFHNLVGKCLRRDPKKRPTARKLLEHKFFQRAADARYIAEHLVARLPHKEQTNEKIYIRARNEDGGRTAPRPSSTLTKAAGGAHPGAGVKLGSWVFDEDEISDFKATEGEAGLDLLTGTLEHHHALPHHHSNMAGVTQVQEEEDDSADFITEQPTSPPSIQSHAQQQQQQQQFAPITQSVPEEPHDFFAGIAAPAVDTHLPDGGSPFLDLAPSPATSSLPPPVTSSTNTGRLSPSAAFAVASSGRLSPAAAFAAVTSGTPHSSTTPTLSSVQGKTRQFVVEEHIEPVMTQDNILDLNNLTTQQTTQQQQISHHSPSAQQQTLSQPPQQQQASAPIPQQQPIVDLLSGDFDLVGSSLTSSTTLLPSASEQFLAAAVTSSNTAPTLDESLATAQAFAITATGGELPPLQPTQTQPEEASSPLNLDALALTPGSATLAYLAAMGPAPTSAPAPAPAVTAAATSRPSSKMSSPMCRPAPSPSAMSELQPTLQPVQRPSVSQAAGSPNARPFNSKLATGPLASLGALSSLLPVQMPVLRQPQQNTSPQGQTRLQRDSAPGVSTPLDDPSQKLDLFALDSTSASSSLNHIDPLASTSSLHLDITSPLGVVQPLSNNHDDNTSQGNAPTVSERQVGRFQVTSTEKHI